MAIIRNVEAGFPYASKTVELRSDATAWARLIVNHFTEHGIVESERLYESPFTDVTPHGPDGLFEAVQVDERHLQAVRASAIAA